MTRIARIGTLALMALALAGHKAAANEHLETGRAVSAETLDYWSALEKRTVRAAQQLSVRAIDSTLTDMRFDQWFRQAVGADAWVSWELNDCGEQTGSAADGARAIPMCVQALAEWNDGRQALVWIVVGVGTEVGGRPELFMATAGRGNRMRDFHSLAQFSRYAQVSGEKHEETGKR